MKQLESDIQAQWIGLLKYHNVLHWRASTTALTHTLNGKTFRKKNPLKGFPDTCGLTKAGRFWAAEIKRPKEKLSPEQIIWKDSLQKYNALYAVITSFDDGLEFVKVITDN